MIKAYKDYAPKKVGNGREVLPAGGYVAKIISAKVDNTAYGDRLIVAFDITDGDYREFFKKDFDNNQNEDKKWRGVYRASVPADDGSERDEWSKRTFNNIAASLEESNPGYTWDWDETRLKGKLIGVLFRNKEWAYNGKTGWTTECCAVTDVQAIRDGKFRMPKDKPLANASVPSFAAPITDQQLDDLLPF